MDYYSHAQVQKACRQTLDGLAGFICQGRTEHEIAAAASFILRKQGISHSWYYGIMALTLVGKRTTLSMSGRTYRATDRRVGKTDLVTVDLSPVANGFWGDYARSFAVVEGRVMASDDQRL